MDIFSLSRSCPFSYRFEARYLAYTAYFQQPDISLEQTGSGHAEEVTVYSSRKRRADQSSEQKQDNKRHRWSGSSADARRLTGDYSIPNTAQRILVPTSASQQKSTPEPVISRPSIGMAVKPGSGRGGQIKPKNTLNEQRHKGGTQHTTPGLGKMNNGQSKAAHKRLSGTPSTRSNTGTNGFDGVESPLGRDVKRRKLDMGPRSATHETTFDLTNDDNENASSMSNSTRITAHRKVSPGQLSSPGQLFESSEFRKVDERTKIPHRRRSRRPKDETMRLSQESSSPVTAPSPGQRMPQTSLAWAVPYGGTNSRKEDPVEIGSAPSGNGKAKHDRALLAINLTKDFPSAKSTSEKQNDELKEIAGVMTRQNQRMPTQRKHLNAAPTPTIESSVLRRQIQQDDHLKLDGRTHSQASRQAEARQEQRLSNTFVRAEENISSPASSHGPEPPGERNPDHPVELPSRVSPIDEDCGSEDELNGPNTRGPSTKPPRSNMKPNPKRNGPDQCSGSPTYPSRSQPRNEETRETPRSSNRSRARKQRTPIESDYTVNIKGFHATSLVSSAEDLSLEYVPEERLIYVHIGGKVATIPGKDRAITIGNGEVNKVCWDREYADLSICLKGPKGDVSSGWIIIDLRSPQDVKWLHRVLVEICDERLCSEATDGNRIQRYRETATAVTEQGKKELRGRLEQAEQAQYLHPRSTHQAQSLGQNADNETPTLSNRTRARASQQRNHEEEKITYDIVPEIEGRRTSGRQLARRGSGVKGPTVSTYFSSPFPSHPSRNPPLLPPKKPKWTEVNRPKPWPSSIIYPSQGTKRITIDFEDLRKLDEDEFLNDNVVGFALRHIEENMPAEHKRNVFFFNTFFYTSLTSLNGRKGFNYDAVKRWTKNVDLMNTPYVVVPINVHLHWFVAIICNLHNVQRKQFDFEEDEEEPHNPASNGPAAQIAEDLAKDDGANGEFLSQSTDAMEQLSLLDKTNSTQTTPGSAKGKSKKKAGPPPRQYDPNAPIIITLDSFGNQHPTETRYLKDYIAAEAKEKRAMQVDRDEIQGMTAKGIPHQTNFSDCGLYMIGYLQEFAKNPKAFVKKVLTRQLDQESDFASFDPSEKRKQIRDVLLELNEERGGGSKDPVKVSATSGQGPASSGSVETQRQQTDRSEDVDRVKTDARRPAATEKTNATLSNMVSKQTIEAKSPDRHDDDELETTVPIALGHQAGNSSHRALYPRNRIEDDDEMLGIVKSNGKEPSEVQNKTNTHGRELFPNIEERFNKHFDGVRATTRADSADTDTRSDSIRFETSSSGLRDHELIRAVQPGHVTRELQYVEIPYEAQPEIPDSQENV